MEIAELVLALLSGASALLAAQKNKTAAGIGVVAADVDAVTLAILQAAAAAKGQKIDWTSAEEVAAYVASLPPFSPIPDPPSAT